VPDGHHIGDTSSISKLEGVNLWLFSCSNCLDKFSNQWLDNLVLVCLDTFTTSAPSVGSCSNLEFDPSNDLFREISCSYFGKGTCRASRTSQLFMRRYRWEDVVPVFDMRLADAARKLDVSESSLKNWKRGQGMKRWPYRQIKALQSKIRNLQLCSMPREMKAGRISELRQQIRQMKVAPFPAQETAVIYGEDEESDCDTLLYDDDDDREDQTLDSDEGSWKDRLARMRRHKQFDDFQTPSESPPPPPPPPATSYLMPVSSLKNCEGTASNYVWLSVFCACDWRTDLELGLPRPLPEKRHIY